MEQAGTAWILGGEFPGLTTHAWLLAQSSSLLKQLYSIKPINYNYAEFKQQNAEKLWICYKQAKLWKVISATNCFIVST